MAISPENMKDGSFTWKIGGFEIDASLLWFYFIHVHGYHKPGFFTKRNHSIKF